MPRFVVLRHETPPGYARPAHFDLMLEVGGVLRTWAALSLPAVGGEPVAAERLPDHRLDYLNYEGPVSGDRGCVSRVDWGTYEPLPSAPNAPNQQRFRLEGTRLRGCLVLAATGQRAENWQVQLLEDWSFNPEPEATASP